MIKRTTQANRNRGPVRDAAPPPAPGQKVREAAAAAVAAILAHNRSLDDWLAANAASPILSGLDPRDRGLLRSIVIVSLRRLGTIRAALDRFIEKPLPRKAHALESVLITAVAQILFLDTPEHSAVDLAVRCAKADSATAPFANLANAVLRNVIRNRDELSASEHAFLDTPNWLAARWKNHWGAAPAEAIARVNRLEPTLDLTVKLDPAGWAQRLDGIILPTGSVRLHTHAPIEQLNGYTNGDWWVQDCAAALPARILDAKADETVADLCAAPGGKTAQLALTGARVIAIDRSAKRLKRLHENLARLRLPAEVRAADALTVRTPPLDGVLIDAPCTATGTIRRHTEIAWNKKMGDIAALAALQSKLLDHATGLLKPNGRLVYCTCSIEPEEGENQIAALLRRNPDLRRDPIRAAETGGLTECINIHGEIRTLPHFLDNEDARLSGMDGFFIARLIRIR